jgi:hypothetical protein
VFNIAGKLPDSRRMEDRKADINGITVLLDPLGLYNEAELAHTRFERRLNIQGIFLFGVDIRCMGKPNPATGSAHVLQKPGKLAQFMYPGACEILETGHLSVCDTHTIAQGFTFSAGLSRRGD